VGLGDHVGDLIESAADEVHELELGHRTQAGEGCAEGGTTMADSAIGVSMTRSDQSGR